MFKNLLIFVSILFAPAMSLACASCGCTLSSDWQDPTKQSGFMLDLRYDYVNQSQLRSGTSTIAPNAASQLMSNGNAQEVEKYTKNNYLTATAEYTVDPSWKIDVLIPYIFRNHSTLGTGSDGTTPANGGGAYDSSTANFGDIRVMERFQGFTSEHNFGVLAGIKLPTATHTLTGNSTDLANPGPQAIDRGLQPGSGTTDLIFGAYYTKSLNKNWDYFGEGLYQSALNSVDQYRPGDGFNLNLGLRFFGYEVVTPQLQINSRYVEHDSGSASDMISTGGTLIYLSPGLIVPVKSLGVEFYTFLQVPVYQNLLGVQLAPTWTGSVGARYVF